jgi:hypothetical protein
MTIQELIDKLQSEPFYDSESEVEVTVPINGFDGETVYTEFEVSSRNGHFRIHVIS